MDFAAELETLRHTGGERLSPTGAARWLQHLTMPPVLLAQCLAVGSKVTQQAVQPIVIAQLPVDGRFGGQLDLADVLLGILQLLAIDVKYTQVCTQAWHDTRIACHSQQALLSCRHLPSAGSPITASCPRVTRERALSVRLPCDPHAAYSRRPTAARHLSLLPLGFCSAARCPINPLGICLSVHLS